MPIRSAGREGRPEVTTRQFNDLPLHEKADLLGACPSAVDRRVIHNRFIVNLYLMDGLYVEVYTCTASHDIEVIEAISRGDAEKFYAHLRKPQE